MQQQIDNAVDFATRKHTGQTQRTNGEPYVNHCIRVANTVQPYTKNINVILAAILHDTLEDTDTTYQELINTFDKEVACLVLFLTNNKDDMDSAGGKAPYLAKRINLLSEDALLIKLADRLDNISDLGDDEKSCLYREQTRYVFLEMLWTNGLPPGHLALIEKIRLIVEEKK